MEPKPDHVPAPARADKSDRINNFDLIRLFAAAQVAVIHAFNNLNVELGFLGYLSWFPGVPVFFFISGFLIVKSWENTKSQPSRFVENRFLRLYPALWVCLAVTIASVFSTGYPAKQGIAVGQWAKWCLAQLTFIQFYNPDFLRSYGLGVVNGSLWTISVELQFYVLAPLVAWMIRKKNAALYLFCAASIVLHIINESFNPRTTAAWKLLTVSFGPWVFMFVFGAMVSMYRPWLDYIKRQNPVVLLVLYVIVYGVSIHFNLGGGNGLTLPAFILFAALATNLAFYKPDTAKRWLRDNDISYGLYIYHKPVYNWFIYTGLVANGVYLALALLVTTLLAVASWRFIEKPALGRKRATIRSAPAISPAAAA